MEIKNDNIIFERKWAMPNKNTYTIKPIRDLLDLEVDKNLFWIDPFANKSKSMGYAKVTNDLNPEFDTDYHLDALEFLKMFDDNSVDGVLFDPPYNCHDKETKILTKEGFKYFYELNYDDYVATLNDKNELEWNKPNKIIKQKYKGKMYLADSLKFNFCVTPNHNMLYSTDTSKDKKYYLDIMEDVKDKRPYFKQGHNPTSQIGIKEFVLPPVELLRHNKYNETYKKEKFIEINTFLKFFAFYLTEGSCDKKGTDYRIRIAQTNQEQRLEIERFLLDLGYKFTIEKNCFTIYDKQLCLFLRQFGYSKDKHIPLNLIHSLNSESLEILLEYLIRGDGTNTQTKMKNGYLSNIKYFRTSSEKMVQSVCVLLGLLGKPYSLNKVKDTSGRICYNFRFYTFKSNSLKEKYITEIEYDDYIYCVNVKNHIILTQREGHLLWSGNSSQLAECYKNVGLSLGDKSKSDYWTKIKKEIQRITKLNSKVISFGWNSGGIGKTLGFEIQKILLVPHGGIHYDTIVTIEIKRF